MAEKDVNQRQIVINLHTGETGKTESLANKLNLGELAVEHVSGENARLHVLRGDGTVGTFIESADTFNAISAATVNVLGQVEAMGFALSADLQTLSGSVVADYALSSVTHSEIETAKGTVIGQAGDSASADTIYGSKAYTDAKIDEVVAGSVTGVTGANYIEAAVVDHNIHVSADTQAMATADADNKGLAEASDVKAYVDTAKDAAIATASAYTNQEINTLSGVAHTEIETAKGWASGYTNQEINTLSSNTHSEIATAKQEAIDTASGYTDGQISALKGDATENGDTLGKLEDRIDAIEEGGVGVQTVSKKEAGGDGSYVTITVDNTNAQNPVISVSDDIQAVASADASNMGLAEASDVKTYVDNAKDAAISSAASYTDTEINTLSSATHTEIETAKGWASGYTGQEINTLSGNLTTMIEGVKSGSDVTIIDSATTEGYLKSYTFMQGSKKIGVIDIPKDLVVTSGEIVVNPEGQPAGTYLKLTIANQTEPVYINVADLADVYTAGSGITISNTNEVAAKVVEANGLSVDGDGIKMAVASSAQTGAMSAADKAKLDSIEADADVNVLEGVQVNGADITIDGEKKVNVTVTSGSANGTIAVNGADVNVTGLKSAAFVTVESLNNTASGYAVAAKNEVIGQNTDESGDTTIYGVREYVNQKVAKVVSDSVTAATGANYINADVANNTVIVSADTQAVASADASNMGLAEASDVKAYVDGAVSGLSGNLMTYTDEAEADAVAAASSYTKTVSGNIETTINNFSAATENAIAAEASARTAADKALSDRIDAITSGSVLSVNSGTNGTYVTLTVDNTDAQNPVISVSDDIQAVASADASNKGLAEASDVKGYVDGEVSGLSGNLITYTDTEIETLSGNVIGNAESTSADTTILGVKAYVDEKVAEKNVEASGDTYVIASADSNTVHIEASQSVKDAADNAVYSANTASNVSVSGHTMDFSNMIIDCGTY